MFVFGFMKKTVSKNYIVKYTQNWLRVTVLLALTILIDLMLIKLPIKKLSSNLKKNNNLYFSQIIQ